MSFAWRRDYLQKIYAWYRQASREEKGGILERVLRQLPLPPQIGDVELKLL